MSKPLEVKVLTRVQRQDMASHTPRDVVERRLRNLESILETSNFERISKSEFEKYQKHEQMDQAAVKDIMQRTFRDLDHPIEVTTQQLGSIFERYNLSKSGALNKSEFSSFYLDFILYIQMMTENILNLKNLLETFTSTSHHESLISLEKKIFSPSATTLTESGGVGSISPLAIDKKLFKNEVEELFMNLGCLVSVKESDLDHCLKRFEKKGVIRIEDLHLLIQELICKLIETTRESLYNVEF